MIPIQRWSEFEPALERIRGDLDQRWNKRGPSFSDTLFRGLRDSEWGLKTTLERWHPKERSLLHYYWKATSAKPQLESIGSRRWDKIPDFPTFKNLLGTDEALSLGINWFLSKQPEVYEYLVYLRHHGFPSPLLDWTASPYVAAFFALDSVAEQLERVCVYAVLRGPFSSSSLDEHCFFVGPYIRTDPRHVLQQSHYSMCAGREAENQEWIFRPHEEAIWDAVGLQGDVFKITIPASERLDALKHLDLMNINPFSLFGSEDSLVRTIARRECDFKDWRL